VSADIFAGASLVQKPKDTVDNLSYGMKLFSRSDANSPGRSTVNSYYDNLKPFLLVMRAMAILPLTSEAGGKY
jgi:hypothetical protein